MSQVTADNPSSAPPVTSQTGGGWGGYVLRRLAFAGVSVVGAISLVFVITRLTGDPATLLTPPGADPGTVELVRARLGLDMPLWTQYLDYLRDVFRGDLGTSYYYGEDVAGLVASRVLPTFVLASTAMALAVTVGVSAGVLAAFNFGGFMDRRLRNLTMLGQAMPSFWLAPLLILVVAVWWKLLPATGMAGPSSLILPALALGALQLAIVFRMARSSAIEALSQDFVRVARAKGVREWHVAVHHVLPATALPVLTVAGIGLASLIGGAVIVESIFSWPGLGNLMIQAVENRDFPVVQGVALVFALAFVLLNTAVDMLYHVVDPRLRQEVG